MSLTIKSAVRKPAVAKNRRLDFHADCGLLVVREDKGGGRQRERSYICTRLQADDARLVRVHLQKTLSTLIDEGGESAYTVEVGTDAQAPKCDCPAGRWGRECVHASAVAVLVARGRFEGCR